MLNRRDFLRRATAGIAATAAIGGLPSLLSAEAPKAKKAITVYKSPTCGCCKSWISHLEKDGWSVTAHDMGDVTAIKQSLGVPDALQSCHTGVVGKYVIEGHVPADLIDKLVAEQPKTIVGLAVPGMVTGSPGMEMPGMPAAHYDVIAFDKAGRTKVYAKR